MIQLTDHMKFNKQKGLSEDASIPLRRGNKIIRGGRRREGSGWRKQDEGQSSGRMKYGRRQERSPDNHENEYKYAAMWGSS